MDNKTANWFLFIFDLLAIGGLLYLFYEHVSVITGIDRRTDTLSFDTGVYYLILLSVFPLFRVVQLIAFFTKKKAYNKMLNIIFITYFILCLLFANLCPYIVKSRLADAGYEYCGQKQSHRVSRGSNDFYQLNGCDEP